MSNLGYANVKSSPGNLRRLKELMQNKDNHICADCGSPDPKWASANIGVFICLKCCGVHRGLGTHISKVLSVTLDNWSDDEIDSMLEVGGNSSANAIYEAFLPKGFSKPGPESSHEERLDFIRFCLLRCKDLGPVIGKVQSRPRRDSRSKYVLQEFLKPTLRIIPKNMDAIPDSERSKAAEVGMEEFIGCLKVKVVKGTNLAIRDMRTSDPYVTMELGHQRVKTKVIKSNLNPIWNEELMLSVPLCYGAVKLQVFDHDTFSVDDIIGEAEINIQPLITAAMAFKDARMFSDMQIGKWLKSHDNALIDDSIINIVDGRVKQEMSLQLQNVESGEVEIELEWIPLDQ